MPMMVTTSINSTSVNPFLIFDLRFSIEEFRRVALFRKSTGNRQPAVGNSFLMAV
jgi:hypothetical protein